jgi:hypothetical protein
MVTKPTGRPTGRPKKPNGEPVKHSKPLANAPERTPSYSKRDGIILSRFEAGTNRSREMEGNKRELRRRRYGGAALRDSIR